MDHVPAVAGQGPLPIERVSVQMGARGLWGEDMRRAMLDYNHMIGVKMVGEMRPNEATGVTLADDIDQYGLRVARVTYAWEENDKALINHSLEQMSASLQAIGAKDMFRQEGYLSFRRHSLYGERCPHECRECRLSELAIFPISECVTDRYFQPSAA